MKTVTNKIAANKKAFFDYAIEDQYEAGIVLEGWEIKSIRSGSIQLRDSYVKIKNAEVWLLGCNISPLISASSHIKPDALRTRKLLLKQKEINKLIGKVEQKGYTIVALDMHFSKGLVKVNIATAKGKKEYDKRMVSKEKELKKEASHAIKKLIRINS